jgi:hypothetical protein
MKFHPDKCKVLTITRKRSILRHQYYLEGHPLEAVTSTKYLGLTIRHDLRWNDHIDNITTKASSTLGFLHRNLNMCSKKIKEQAYFALVRPQLEYAPSVWDPFTQNMKKKLESIQRRSARFVLRRYRNTSSVSAMLEELKWKTLEERRKISRLTTMYKIVNNITKIKHTMIKVDHSHVSRHTNSAAYQIPHSTKEYEKYSFFPRTIRDWNKLPDRTANAVSLDSFKNLLH